MTATFRHKRSRQGVGRALVTVLANDGRMLPEEFLVDEAELRRFAWAVLADLAPAEARAAAAEDGLDLAAAVRGQPQPRTKRHRASTGQAPILPGSAHHDLLMFLARVGTATVAEIQAALPARATGWRNVIRALQLRGLLERANEGSFGVLAVYGLTGHGLAAAGVPRKAAA